MKPMLASNYDPEKVRYPVIVQPKIDGVRGWNPEGNLLGRSLKQHANPHVNKLFSGGELVGLDGEIAVGPFNVEDTCRVTTGALNRSHGKPPAIWYVFDLVNTATIDLPYAERLEKLKQLVSHLNRPDILAIPHAVVTNPRQLQRYLDFHLTEGLEGTILRDPAGMHKAGRSTVREGGLLRVKGFEDAEAEVLEILEGNHNANEATKNELGRTSRSSAKAGMVPNGLLGKMVCRNLADDAIITVGPGKMKHDERKFYFENPEQLISQIITYQHFPKGRKDAPRFPTYQRIRARSDIGDIA